MKKLQFIIFFLLIAILLAIWSPWTSWNIPFSKLFGVDPVEQTSGLLVSSLAGEITVYIDNVNVGTTSSEDSDPLLIPDVDPGDRYIKLVRSSNESQAYIELDRLVTFVEGTSVVLGYELGPTAEFSAGHIISISEKNENNSETLVNFKATPANAKVLIDGISIGETPIVAYPLDITRQHTISVSAPGYENQEFKLLPSDQAERDALKGYTLIVETKLFLQPLRVR